MRGFQRHKAGVRQGLSKAVATMFDAHQRVFMRLSVAQLIGAALSR
jgi:hypothetical protein